MNATHDQSKSQILSWHPHCRGAEAEFASERTVEADSNRVPGTIAHRESVGQGDRERMAKARELTWCTGCPFGWTLSEVHEESN